MHQVRVKAGGVWRAGTAVVLPGDDPAARSRSLPYQWDAAIGRAMASAPLTMRIDLAPAPARPGARNNANRPTTTALGSMAGIPVLARCFLTGPFAAATAVKPAAAGEWEAFIVPGWEIAGNANGGYLLAMATRALVGAAGRPDPVTVTAHYLSPGRPVRIATQILKEGKRFATGTATMSSGTRPVLAVLGTVGDLSQAAGPELIEGAPPELPSPEECVRVVPSGTFPPPFMGHVDLRLHPGDAAFATGRQSGQPLMRGWFRLPESEPVDSLALLCAVDAFPPTAFNARLPIAWTPTVELTAHIRANPAPGWLRCRFSTRFVSSGFLEEDGEVWDSAGRLVGQSRQLALVPQA
jgi:acyl-Coa thioesterase superfamily protein/acyl-CoA thioesterase superfamily protein